MEHTNEIAIQVLRNAYNDYDENFWHYNEQYFLIVIALESQQQKIEELFIEMKG